MQKEHIDVLFLYFFAGIFFILLIVNSFLSLSKVTAVLPVGEKVSTKKQQSIFFEPVVFNTIAVEAKAYVVYDLIEHKVIASKNEEQVLPLASITKVMTAISASLHKSLDQPVIITPKKDKEKYDLGIQKNQTWPFSELLKYTLVFSSNDGAEIIANQFGGKELFVAQMNNDVKSLGLNMVFTDPAGLDSQGKVGGLGTALEVAKVLQIARERMPNIMDATTKKRLNVNIHNEQIRGIPNTNQDVSDFLGLEASKTGFTDLAGGNLGIILDAGLGRPVAIVVLGSSREGRFRDMHVLYEALKKSIIKKD